MAMLGEKLGGGPVDRPAGVLRIVSGALFLGSSRVCPTLLSQHERLLCMGTGRRKRMSGVRGQVWKVYVSCVLGFPLQGVHRFEML
jgi:hypothetical protein